MADSAAAAVSVGYAMQNAPTATKSRLTFFEEQRPAVMVVGHERSGVHFLMNSIAACYGYVSSPHVDFDRHLFNINYFHAPEIESTLLNTVAARPLANCVKSHHSAGFFDGVLSHVTRRFVLFYIYRDPVAVMWSFWLFIRKWNWVEGPKAPGPVTFALEEPCGQMMRYQTRQYPNLMLRWASHVEGWLDAAQDQTRIVPIRYEDLDGKYEDTMRRFAEPLERQPHAIVRPTRDRLYIKGTPDDVQQSDVPGLQRALRNICERTVGKTMARCGY